MPHKPRGLFGVFKGPNPEELNINDQSFDLPDSPTLPDTSDTPQLKDSNFQSELEYDGYQDIEEYDNNTYNATALEEENSEKELSFEDRQEDPNTEEENLIDPQENRK